MLITIIKEISNITQYVELKAADPAADYFTISGWEMTDLGPPSKSETSNKNLQVTAIIDLGEGKIAKATAKVQMQEVMFGGSMGRKFINVVDHSEHLTATTAQGEKLITNYVKGTVQMGQRLQISYNGYLENTDYERQFFQGTGFIQAL
ncbi:hypothetical protein [Paenibacillus terrigena]|uniref:hypothetical protein n=1 Tax=Paenibacillus terrigena TaxID=369333 RepID=UPI0028D54D0F|nr:hypothetical protein [Paenibacillus terrigena]